VGGPEQAWERAHRNRHSPDVFRSRRDRSPVRAGLRISRSKAKATFSDLNKMGGGRVDVGSWIWTWNGGDRLRVGAEEAGRLAGAVVADAVGCANRSSNLACEWLARRLFAR